MIEKSYAEIRDKVPKREEIYDIAVTFEGRQELQ